MTQAEKLERAKELTEERLKEALGDFVQVGAHSYASMEEVGNDEIWTVTTIVAKKKFDPDEAVDEYEFEKQERAEREAKRKARLAERKGE